jgi:hypothetical protein
MKRQDRTEQDRTGQDRTKDDKTRYDKRIQERQGNVFTSMVCLSALFWKCCLGGVWRMRREERERRRWEREERE